MEVFIQIRLTNSALQSYMQKPNSQRSFVYLNAKTLISLTGETNALVVRSVISLTLPVRSEDCRSNKGTRVQDS
jgi:hypothetical protein